MKTVWDMCTELVKAGCQKEQAFLREVMEEIYIAKGEQDLKQTDVRKVRSLYNGYFQRDGNPNGCVNKHNFKGVYRG